MIESPRCDQSPGDWILVYCVASLPYHMCEQNALFLDVSSELFGLSSRGIKLREFGRWE